jgi:hypothetical protein
MTYINYIGNLSPKKKKKKKVTSVLHEGRNLKRVIRLQ